MTDFSQFKSKRVLYIYCNDKALDEREFNQIGLLGGAKDICSKYNVNYEIPV